MDPVVTTASVILSSDKIQNGDILVTANRGCPGKWPLNELFAFFSAYKSSVDVAAASTHV